MASQNKIDSELCDRCAIQKEAGFRYKNQQSYYQGKIDEPYFENSWLFGSPRYLKYAALPGNMPSTDAIAYAEAAQKTAREGDKMKGEGEGAEKEKGKRKTNPDKKITLPKPKDELKKGVAIVKINAVAVESDEAPIEAIEVVRIPLKLLYIDGAKFWHDANKNQVYEFLENDGIGKQIGRFDTEKKKVVKTFSTVGK